MQQPVHAQRMLIRCVLVAARTLVNRLAVARQAAGHTQAECVDLLRTRFGAPERSQASMSRYLNGKQQMPLDVRRAVSQYVEIFGTSDPPDDADEADQQTSMQPGSDAFAGAVRCLTDERLLGPRQGAFIDAVITRLRETARRRPATIELRSWSACPFGSERIDQGPVATAGRERASGRRGRRFPGGVAPFTYSSDENRPLQPGTGPAQPGNCAPGLRHGSLTAPSVGGLTARARSAPATGPTGGAATTL